MRNFKFIIIIFNFSLLIFNFATADAATYYASPSGTGTVCSFSSPCLLTTGVPRLLPGDILYLRGGTYTEYHNWNDIFNVPSGTSWAGAITVSGYPGEKAYFPDGINIQDNLSGSSPSYIILDDLSLYGFRLAGNTHHIRLSNSDIDGKGTIGNGNRVMLTSTTAFHEVVKSRIHGAEPGAYGFYINGKNLLIEGNEIYDNGGYAVHLYLSGGSGVNDNVIRNNLIHNNCFSDGARGQGLNAVILASGSNNKFYNNIVYNNQCVGGGGAVTTAYGASYSQIFNNTVFGNKGAGIEINTSASNASVKNNIIYGNAGGTLADWGGPGAVYSHNLCNGSGPGCSVVGDPKFVNSSGNDYHLQSSSPAINQGADLSLIFIADKDGIMRVPPFDIGAYEYGGIASVLTGDLNGDKIVNSLDWSLMSAKWLTNDTNADLNKDGAVNSLDWSIMSSNWLKAI